MDVTGTTNLKSTLTVAGKTTAKAMSATDISASTITTTGNASVGGTLTVKGSAVVGGKNVVLTVNGFTANASGAVTVPNYEQDGVKIVSNPDYNTITAPGFYQCNITGAQNGPGYASKMVVLSEKGSRTHATQIAFPISKNENLVPKVRQLVDGVWKNWATFVMTRSAENIVTTGDIVRQYTETSGRYVLQSLIA